MLQYLFLIWIVSVLIINVFFGFKMHTDMFLFFFKVNIIYRQTLANNLNCTTTGLLLIK